MTTERIARFEHQGVEGYGALGGDGMLDLLEGPGYGGLCRTGGKVPLSDVRLLAPVANPRLIGVGLNYAAHAAESGHDPQSTSTADLIFSVAELIEYLSAAVTLLPGDVIMTGTPSGVGEVQPGDVVEIEIERIGVLRNPVVAEGDA